jgi:hypothetical protein
MTGHKNALAVREAVGAGHPEISIASPMTSASGCWELSVGDSSTLFDDFWMMVDHLAAMFADAEPGAGEDVDESTGTVRN